MKEFTADKVRKALRENGIAEGRIFDKALLDQAEQELKRQYLAARPLRRHGHDHGHAARAQPRRAELHHRRRRGRQDPRRSTSSATRRSARRELLELMQLRTPGLADLVHASTTSTRARSSSADLETLRSYYLEPRLPRVQHRLDAGVDHARQAATSTSRSTSTEGDEVHGLRRQARRRAAAARGRADAR